MLFHSYFIFNSSIADCVENCFIVSKFPENRLCDFLFICRIYPFKNASILSRAVSKLQFFLISFDENYTQHSILRVFRVNHQLFFCCIVSCTKSFQFNFSETFFCKFHTLNFRVNLVAHWWMVITFRVHGAFYSVALSCTKKTNFAHVCSKLEYFSSKLSCTTNLVIQIKSQFNLSSTKFFFLFRKGFFW